MVDQSRTRIKLERIKTITIIKLLPDETFDRNILSEEPSMARILIAPGTACGGATIFRIH